jgi:site-specific DNA-adenine methylase
MSSRNTRKVTFQILKTDVDKYIDFLKRLDFEKKLIFLSMTAKERQDYYDSVKDSVNEKNILNPPERGRLADNPNAEKILDLQKKYLSVESETVPFSKFFL